MKIKYLLIIITLFSLNCRTAHPQEGAEPVEMKPCSKSEKEFAEEFNAKFYQIRIDLNLAEPVRDPDLDRAALKFAGMLKERGTIEYGISEKPLVRLQMEGIKRGYVAENVAKINNRQNSIAILLEKWTAGKVERDNMTDSKYHFFGFGLASTEKYCYCVLLLTD